MKLGMSLFSGLCLSCSLCYSQESRQFLIERIVITTDSGVTGLSPGTEIQVISRDGHKVHAKVTESVFDVLDSQITADPVVASALSRADTERQKVAADCITKTNVALSEQRAEQEKRAATAQREWKAAHARTTNVTKPEAMPVYLPLIRDETDEVEVDYERELLEGRRRRIIEQRQAESEYSTGTQSTAVAPISPRFTGSTVTPNAYGLGLNSDEFGRPHVYRTEDGRPLSPIFQDQVQRDTYGLGAHSDSFGRLIRDGAP